VAIVAAASAVLALEDGLNLRHHITRGEDGGCASSSLLLLLVLQSALGWTLRRRLLEELLLTNSSCYVSRTRRVDEGKFDRDRILLTSSDARLAIRKTRSQLPGDIVSNYVVYRIACSSRGHRITDHRELLLHRQLLLHDDDSTVAQRRRTPSSNV